MSFLKKNIHTLTLLLIICLFSLLLFKDLFSARSLVPNLEPYPDALYYIVPARNLAAGQGLVFSREGRQLTPNIPPLYSLVIFPVFLISQDPRMFYFANILLSALSFYLLYKVLNQLTKNKWLIDLTLFLYATNFFIYWYPTVPMAENLILTLYLFGLWLVVKPPNQTRLILMAFLPVAFIASKYANLPVTITFLGAFIWKIIFQLQTRDKITKIITFSLCLLMSGLLFLGYEYIFKNHNILASVFSLFNPSTLFSNSNGQKEVATNSWFSIQYVKQNLPIYLYSLIGQPMRFLWDFTPIIPTFLGFAGLAGLIIGSFQKDRKLVSLCILISIFSTILFLSTFYSSDARYIYFVIPALLIGFVILLDYLQRSHSYRKVGFLVLIGLFLFYSATNFSRVKNQISLNLKHTETPWYYVSVLEVDKYFSSVSLSNQKVAIISPMPPFLFDFYSQKSSAYSERSSDKKYIMLPLSKDQEFRSFKEIIWGPNDYSNLNVLYKNYINKGYSVYVAEYGMGNEAYLHEAFNQIKNDFSLVKVHEGCFNACNLYQLENK